MISVLLTILKILGIIILVLLGIVATVLLLVLFVPVRYMITAERKTEDEAVIHAKVKITWLLHILNMMFVYPEAAYLRIRVLCFTVFRSDQQKEDPDGKTKTGSENSEEKKSEPESSKTKKQNPEEEKKTESEALKERKQVDFQKPEGKKKTEPETLEEKKQTGSQTLEEEVPTKRGFFRKLFGVVKNIKYTIRKIYDKIKHILKNIEYYLKVVRSETFKRAFGVCSSQITALLRGIRPRKLKGNLLIGTGDPASTGQVLAVYGMLYPLIGNNVIVTPDFEKQIVEGDLLIKGRITAFHLLRVAWKVYFNKDIRRVIKLLKREAA